MATREDVARLAGVSAATVSHVINRTKYVSPALIKKVESAIAELGYRPNWTAKALAGSRSYQVGFLVSDIANPYYGGIVEGMEEVARENGYLVSLLMASQRGGSLLSLLERGFDGIFVATTQPCLSAEQTRQLLGRGVKLINAPGGAPVLRIVYEQAMEQALNLLLAQGRKTFAYLSGGGERDERRVVCERFCAEHNLHLRVQRGIPAGESSLRAGYAGMMALLAQERPDAVIATNDLMALGALRALGEAGISLPGQVALLGCDDIPQSAYHTPSLSTLQVPVREVGRQAMHMLLGLISGQEVASQALSARFIRRETTG